MFLLRTDYKRSMEDQNQTAVTEFLFLGLTDQLHQQILLFVTLVFVYLVTLGGNLGMITLIWMDPRLHTPMYFFLSHLSFVDMCSSSSIAPKVLCDIFAEKKGISFLGCAAQMWFLGLFVATECFLLAAMAIDRYVAICNPLHYTTTMNPRRCLLLVITSWLVSHLHSLTHTILMARLSFCGPNIIHHFFCDVQPLLMLSCSDTSVNELLAFTEGSFVIMSPFLLITIPYAYISHAVLWVPSGRGRFEVFSTCGSHLTVVALFYITIISMYICPLSTYSVTKDRVVTVIYSSYPHAEPFYLQP